MSYDLYLYNGRGGRRALATKNLMTMLTVRPLEMKDLRSFLDSYEYFNNFANVKNGFDAGYHNKDTGTMFRISMRPETIAELEAKKAFPDFSYTGLKVTISFLRPSYFGHEAAPIIEAICDRYGLYVLDPQYQTEPKNMSAADIIKSWESANETVTRNAAARTWSDNISNISHDLLKDISRYMPKEKSLEWWSYTVKRRKVENYLKTASIRVNMKAFAVKISLPELKLLYRIADKKLLRVVTLPPEAAGYIVPLCDAFILTRNGEGPRMVMSEVVQPTIERYLKPWTFAGLEFMVLTAQDAQQIAQEIRDRDFEAPNSYESLSPGSYTDVEL
ncbi:MAG TPA: hypothetical protein VK436_14870 [Methanocella sp.]|nr:hypothetical protein [Methanocella sp.]